MSKDHFAMPGDDRHKKPDINPSANKDIFQKPKAGGGGGPKRKPEPVAEPDIEQIPNNPPPPPPKEPPVKLSNPKWSVDSAQFEDTVSLSVDVLLPESLKEIKRVIISVFALYPNGEKPSIKIRDLYVNDEGKVQGEFVLHRPPKQDNKEIESCPYVFTAKHRDSKEIESPRLPVKEKPRGNDELVLELASSEKLKTEGLAFHLKSKDGSVNSKIETKNGEEKEGMLTLKFIKLDPNLEYALDMLNAQGKIVESIFPNTPFGKWAEGAK